MNNGIETMESGSLLLKDRKICNNHHVVHSLEMFTGLLENARSVFHERSVNNVVSLLVPLPRISVPLTNRLVKKLYQNKRQP